MLFNSYEFIFIFLPISLIGFYCYANNRRITSVLWLVLISFIFYLRWEPIYFFLVSFSISFNYYTGRLLLNYHLKATEQRSIKKGSLLSFGIFINLLILSYFKYSYFIANNVKSLFGLSYSFEKITLPLAISFFTFQQIAYLVDVYRGGVEKYDFINYSFFVVFFPHLIAGPIVLHNELIPQLEKKSRLHFADLSVGLTIFCIGLFKKTVIADGLSVYSGIIFDAAERNVDFQMIEAWGGALSYALQIYFDFSGYSDMAIGVARMFGFYLPLNFNSPYKSESIIEFWRRWHISLSHFLRDYLYIPLAHLYP